MRAYLLMAAVAMLAMAVAPAMAQQPLPATDAWIASITDSPSATGEMSVTYAQTDGGAPDHEITYGGVVPTPELGTWALLLSTGAIGGWLRRRRSH